MKKTLFIPTFAISLLLISTPFAFATGSSGSDSDFNYIPMNVSNVLGAQAVTTSPSFNPVTFCGSLVCYNPAFIRSAYNFPSTLDGTGQTIVIVDAYGSPTIT